MVLASGCAHEVYAIKKVVYMWYTLHVEGCDQLQLLAPADKHSHQG